MCSRTCRGHVHEPVRTLANTSISFRRLPQGEKKAGESLRRCPSVVTLY